MTTLDKMDAIAIGEFLTDDCVFIFGNMPPVKGKEAIV